MAAARRLLKGWEPEPQITMMIQKIFHMNQSASETRRRLKNIGSYRHHLDGVDEAQGEFGLSNWKLRLPLGFKVDLTLEELACAEENVLLFSSLGGDVHVMGSLTFHEITRGLTEVEFVVDYESSSRVFNIMDRMLNIGEHFVVNQLRRVRAHFEGIAVPVAPRSVPFLEQSLARV
jgi:uncharacterized membrane protein